MMRRQGRGGSGAALGAEGRHQVNPNIWGMGLGRYVRSSPSPPLPHPSLVITGETSHPLLKPRIQRAREWGRG